MPRQAAEPLGSRFAKLWAASTTSALGSGLATIAAPLHIAGSYLPQARPAADQDGRARSQLSALRADLVDGLRWLMRQRLLRTMAILMGLLNVTLTGTSALLVLLARERLGVGSVGYGLLFTSEAAGAILGSAIGDKLIRWVSTTWTIRIGFASPAPDPSGHAGPGQQQ